MKINKNADYDDTSFNVFKKSLEFYTNVCLHKFNLSLQTDIFSGKLNISSITSLLKGGENYELGNYRPISVLQLFAKIMKKIIYNCLYKYLTDNGIFYKKQFGFQEGHSTWCAIVHLKDQIRNGFESNQYTFKCFCWPFQSFWYSSS